MNSLIDLIKLSPDQKNAMDFIVSELGKKTMLVTMGGYAGVGKTTVTAKIVEALRPRFKRIAFACYTGKAKSVLEAKLRAFNALAETDFCGTLHQLLYRPLTHEERERTAAGHDHITMETSFETPEGRGPIPYDLIILDEASMVNETIYDDLVALNVPILAVGDHGQLKPVFGNFNLMENPMIRLEQIHRQAEGNPIIKVSMLAREEGDIPYGEWTGEDGTRVIKTRDRSILAGIPNLWDWMIITATNAMRCRANAYVRRRRFGTAYSDKPMPGDKLICLANNHGAKIFNGMVGILEEYRNMEGDLSHLLKARIDFGETIYDGLIFKYQFGKPRACKETQPECPKVHPQDFGDLIDYGFALTCHKSQGSEMDCVVVQEEAGMKRRMQQDGTWRRWLYTAATRSRKQLIIVGE